MANIIVIATYVYTRNQLVRSVNSLLLHVKIYLRSLNEWNFAVFIIRM